jgi:flagellar hook protein FlgE
MPFRIALSGLDAAQTDLEVTGHNIANAATTGFKESRAEFSDLYASSIQDVSTAAAGRGVRVSRVAQQFSQGNIDFTGNNLDLAISGEGFFILQDAGTNNTEYTRAGAFGVDRDGYVVNHANQRLQVYPATTVGNVTAFNTGVLSDLLLPTAAGAPSATTEVITALNLDAQESVLGVAFNPADPTTYNHSTSTTVYDSLGGGHVATMYYVKTANPREWDVHLYVTDPTGVQNNVTANAGADTFMTLQFNTDGTLGDILDSGGVATGLTTIQYDGVISDPAADPITMEYDYTQSTQYGAPFGVNNLAQNGYTSGRLSGLDTDTSGVIYARFTNGQSLALGKVALARFNNAQGLQQVGDTNWAQSFTSGDAQLGEPGSASLGLIQSGALEGSNVDVATQLVNLITAQRNFQANAQVITTADTVTNTVIQMIR